MSDNKTITLPFDVAQEIMLALSERRQHLSAEQIKTHNPAIKQISERQQARVESGMRVIQDAIGERWI